MAIRFAGFKYIIIAIFIAIFIVIVMATTIQVSEQTKHMIDMAREKIGAKTYDETIHKILIEELRTPKSMFGKIRLSSWTKNDRMAI